MTVLLVAIWLHAVRADPLASAIGAVDYPGLVTIPREKKHDRWPEFDVRKRPHKRRRKSR